MDWMDTRALHSLALVHGVGVDVVHAVDCFAVVVAVVMAAAGLD